MSAEREPHIIFTVSDLFYDYEVCEGCPLCAPESEEDADETSA